MTAENTSTTVDSENTSLSKTSNKILWNSRSSNVKTGDVPTAWVGRTKDETLKSCKGCPMLGNGCYAHKGTTSMGRASTQKRAAKHPEEYTVQYALNHRAITAKMVRISAIGDVGHPSIKIEEVLLALADIHRYSNNSLEIIGYTHFWRLPRNQQYLRKYLRASCSNELEAQQALRLGWKPVIVSDLPKEKLTDNLQKEDRLNNLVRKVCLYYTKGLDCNNCLACSVKNDEIIVFPRI
jgi:hypothetical protein